VVDRLGAVPVPAAALAGEILGPRFRDGSTGPVEDLLRAGELVWQGLPGKRVALLSRDQASLLVRPPAAVDREEGRAVEETLARRGASFLSEVSRETALPEEEVLRALFPLVWAGRVTNDALAGFEEPQRRDRRARTRPPLYGRWSLLPSWDPDPGGRAEAWALRLLHVYGVVAREMAAAAELPIPWAPVLDALTTLEAQGRARRGYFVRDLSGVQFALPQVVERLRRPPADEVRVVAASDPASPYGRLLPIPGAARVQRTAGNWLVLRGGVPILSVEARGRRLVPVDGKGGMDEAVAALVELASAMPGGRLKVESWGDAPVIGSEGASLLESVGFSRGPRQMTYRAPAR
jgi:ATP-dependent Lhr-like helicase